MSHNLGAATIQQVLHGAVAKEILLGNKEVFNSQLCLLMDLFIIEPFLFSGEHIPSQSDGDRCVHCRPSCSSRAKEGRVAVQWLRLRDVYQEPEQSFTVEQTPPSGVGRKC